MVIEMTKILTEMPNNKWKECIGIDSWYDLVLAGWKLMEVRVEKGEAILVMTRSGYINRFKEGVDTK